MLFTVAHCSPPSEDIRFTGTDTHHNFESKSTVAATVASVVGHVGELRLHW